MELHRMRRTALAVAALSLLAAGCADAADGSPAGLAAVDGEEPGASALVEGVDGGGGETGAGVLGASSAVGSAVGSQVVTVPSSGGVSPGVTVSGSGRVSGRPDALRASLGVEVERDSVQDALAAANEATEAVLSALRDNGVAEQDLQTTQFSVQPRYTEGVGTAEVVGYVVTNLVEAKVRDLNAVGEVLQAAVSAGGNAARVQGVSFTLEDNAALLDAARESAFADARRKAEQYAELAGRRLGALIGVSEVVADAPPPRPFVEGGAAAFDAAAVPIEPGQQEVGVTVTAVWGLD